MKIIQHFFIAVRNFIKRHWSLSLIGKYLSYIIYKPVSAILYWQIHIMCSVHTDVIGRSMAQKHSLGFFSSVFFLIIFVNFFIQPRSHCPGLRPGASRQFAAGGPGRTGTNRDGIRVRSHIPGSATDQARLGHKLITVCPGNATVFDGAFPV